MGRIGATERVFQALARAIAAAPRLWWGVGAVGSLIGLGLFSQMGIQSDPLDALPRGNVQVETFRKVSRELTAPEQLTALVTAGRDQDITDILGFVDFLAERLQTVSFVKRISYRMYGPTRASWLEEKSLLFLSEKGLRKIFDRMDPSKMRVFLRHQKHLLLSPFGDAAAGWIQQDPLGLGAIFLQHSVIRPEWRKTEFVEGYWVSRDHRAVLLFAETDADAGLPLLGQSRLQRLRATADKALEQWTTEQGEDHAIRIGWVGPRAMGLEIQEVLRWDMAISFLSSLVLVFLLFLVVYREKIRVFVAMGAALFAALSWTFGLAYLLYGRVNLTTCFVAALLMGLGIDYLIYLYHRFQENWEKTASPAAALEQTFIRIGKPVGISALTTSLAFFSILTTSFEGLHEMGVVAGIGVLSCAISSFLLFGSTLVDWAERGRLPPSKAPSGIAVWGNFLHRHAGLALLGGGALMALLASGGWRLALDNRLEAIGLEKSRVLEDTARYEKHFGKRAAPLILVFEEEDGGASLGAYRMVSDRVEKLTEVGSVFSLSHFVPPDDHQRNILSHLERMRGDPAVREVIAHLPRNLETALREEGFIVSDDQIRYAQAVQRALRVASPLSPQDLLGNPLGPWRSFIGQEGRLRVMYIFPSGEGWSHAGMETVIREARAVAPSVLATGLPRLLSEIGDTILPDAVRASILALTLVVGMLVLHFRSLPWVMLALLPLGVGFVMTLGAMGFLGLRFNYVNLAGLPILIGIGIDYGIHLVQRFREAPEEGITGVVQRTGKSVCMAALTTMVGFGSLGTAQFHGMVSLGWVVVLGVGCTLWASLFVLPAFLAVTARSPVFSRVLRHAAQGGRNATTEKT